MRPGTCGWTVATCTTCDVGARVEAGLALVPEDRQAAGLVQTMSVRENMTLSSLTRLSRRVATSRRARSQGRAADRSTSLRVKAPGTARTGRRAQRRQPAEGRDRARRHEPAARAADGRADARRRRRGEVRDPRSRCAAWPQEGLGIIFATSELAEIQAVATRVLVMARGRVIADLRTQPTSRPTRSRPPRQRRRTARSRRQRWPPSRSRGGPLLALVLQLRAAHRAGRAGRSPSRCSRRSS